MKMLVNEEWEVMMIQVVRKPEVNIIPATKRSVESGGQIKKQKFLRVAAYCRVSTDDESQQTSYATQNAFYTQMITWHPGWTLAGIYADEAISGTSRARRKDFNRMMDDAQNGKVDYIITKSISRFARNTVDTLNCVRQLRQLNPPVGIFFEKENIDTLDVTGELILTILSALAQDESRSTSDNIRWSIQRKFQRGEAIVDLKRMLGYEKGANGEWVINPEQAEIVRYIFEQFISGISANRIAKRLNEMGKQTARGNRWRADAVLFILRNEKYVGDLEMQKTITKNFLTHKSSKNNGEAPRYYVKDHHEGIIDRLKWDKACAMLLEAGTHFDDKGMEPEKRRGSKASPFTNLVCGVENCSEKLFRIGYHKPLPTYTDERSIAAQGEDSGKFKERYYFYYPVWRCIRNVQGSRNPGKGKCSSGSIHECALEQSFMEMLYKLKRDYDDNGNDSHIMMLFRKACRRMEIQVEHNCYSEQRLELLDLQIRDLEEKLQNNIEDQADRERKSRGFPVSCGLSEEIHRQLKELTAERSVLEEERRTTAVMCKNFEFFLRCLDELPKENSAGMRININRLDVEGSIFRDINGKAIAGKRSRVRKGQLKITEEKINEAPDFLNFEKGIYMAFIKSGYVKGNDVEYMTNFGVKLTSSGNSRTLSSFMGFRKANPDGTVELLDENWKVGGRGVCYVRTEIE